MRKNELIKKVVSLKGKKFEIIINHKHNVATGNFVKFSKPVTSREIADFLVLHYEYKTRHLIGFTILHLVEFIKHSKKILQNHIGKQQELKEWLKEKAEQSIYEVVNNRQYYSLFSIPEPLWHIDKHY